MPFANELTWSHFHAVCNQDFHGHSIFHTTGSEHSEANTEITVVITAAAADGAAVVVVVVIVTMLLGFQSAFGVMKSHANP